MSSKLAYRCVHVYFKPAPISFPFVPRYSISVYRSCFALLVFYDHLRSGCADKPLRGQTTRSELTGFLWLCLSEECLPKKDAASWGPHFGTFPSDPSLKAPAAAEEIRGWKTLDGITTGEHRSSSDWRGSTQQGSTLVDSKLLMTPYVPGSCSSLFLLPGVLLESTTRELF